MSNDDGNKVESGRQDLLLRMYDQMFNDINRHITVVWQPITVVFGSLALFASGTKNIISIDFAATFIILLVGWLIATLYDSTYWYNRNLAIIANIERQLLKQSDLRHIHYYFGKHRAKNSMLTHIRIQRWLGLSIGAFVLLHHFFNQVIKMLPCISNSNIDARLEVSLPYLAAWVAFFFCKCVRKQRIASYNEFRKNSPGIEIDTSGIKYGIGHPVDGQTPETEILKREEPKSDLHSGQNKMK